MVPRGNVGLLSGVDPFHSVGMLAEVSETWEKFQKPVGEYLELSGEDEYTCCDQYHPGSDFDHFEITAKSPHENKEAVDGEGG